MNISIITIIRSWVALFLFLLVLTSCGKNHQIKNFEKYIPTNIPKKSIGNIDVENDSYKVVIPEFTVTNAKDAKELGLSDIAVSYLSNKLSSFGITVLDRKLSDKITQELALREMQGNTVQLKDTSSNNIIHSSSMPDLANYAILGSIDEVTFNGSLSDMGLANAAANVTLAVATGGRYFGGNIIASRYKYNAIVSGKIQVIDLATGKIILTNNFTHSNQDSEAAQGNSGGVLITIAQLKTAKDKDSTLIAKTLKAGLDQAILDIISIITPIGYIVERRDINAEYPPIFRVSFGKNDKIKPGEEVIFTTIKESINQLTMKTEQTEEVIATGIVSQKIDDLYSWVIIEDPGSAAMLQLGDIGKIKRKMEL